MTTRIPKTLLLLALMTPGVAWAEGTVLMAPLIPKGVEPKVSNNITSLLSSELDFSGAFDSVKELPAAPSTLTATCLGQTSCLGALARANGVDAVVAGTIGPGTKGLQLYLVLYDAKKNVIVRKKTYDASADSSTLATAATSYINELVTGQSASQEKAADAATMAAFSDTSDVDDDFAFEAAPPPPKPTTSSKTASSTSASRTRVTTTVAPRPLDDDLPEFDEPEDEEAYLDQKRAAEAEARRREEEARRREEEARLAAEAAAKARADAERRAREEQARIAREEAEREAREAAEQLAREEAARIARAEEARREAAARAAAAAAAKTTTTSRSSSSSSDDFSFGSAAGDIDIEFDSSASGIVMEVEEEEEADPVPYYSRSSSSRSSGSSSSRSSSSSVPDFGEGEDEGETLSRSGSSRSATSRSYDEDEDEPRASSLRDLDEDEEPPDFDEDEPPSRSSSSRDDDERSTTASRSSSSSREEDRAPSYRSSTSSSRYEDERRSSVSYEPDGGRGAVTITPRAGYARFYDFNFVTYGAELGIPIAPTAVLVAGIEGYSTQRELSAEVVEELSKIEGLPPSEINANPWNTILPINLGVQYKSPGQAVRPYAGADITITPYTADFDVAFGARARVGADFMVAEVFGFNLNLGAGIMSGSKFEEIQAGTKNTGLVPQVSAGTVFAF